MDRFLVILSISASVWATAAVAQTEELPLPSSQAVPLTLEDPLWNAAPAGPDGDSPEVAPPAEKLPLPSQRAVPLTMDDPLWNAPPADPRDGGRPQEIVPQLDIPRESLTFRDALNGFVDKPIRWFSPAHWDSSWEIGLNGSHGSADTNSFRTGLELSRETTDVNWDITLIYAKNQSDGVETQHNVLMYSINDWKINSFPGWSISTKTGVEYDEFKNFNTRFNINTGLGYLFIDSPISELRGRFGSGANREFGGDDENWQPEAVFGVDFSHQVSDKQNMSLVFDHYPSWGDFSDYRIVANFSWEMVINEKGDLSVKINVIDRYDSTSNGARPNDVGYALVLIWAL